MPRPPSRWLPRAPRALRRPALAVCVLTLASVSAAGVHAWNQARTDARTRERFAQLRADPLLSALDDRFGGHRAGDTLFRCHEDWFDGPTPPHIDLVYQARNTAGVRSDIAAPARSSGWHPSAWEQRGGPPAALELTKPYGGWLSDSCMTLDRDGLVLTLRASDGMHCS